VIVALDHWLTGLSRQQAEWEYLRALCAEHLAPGARLRFCRALEPGVFREWDYRVAFEEICVLLENSSSAVYETLRQFLPGRVTARGLPEFAYDELFRTGNLSSGDLERRLQGLTKFLSSSSG
jgi:hypothetical protein